MNKNEHSGYSEQQKEWFLRRDNYECQFPVGIHDKCGKTDVQVHHITPRHFAFFYLNWTKEEVNSPENGICLCREHHWLIHRENQHNNRFGNRYATIPERHRNMTIRGIPYWNTRWDKELKAIAQIRTLAHQMENPDDKFPFAESEFAAETKNKRRRSAVFELSVWRVEKNEAVGCGKTY